MHSTIFCQSHRAYLTVLAVFLFFLTACDPLPEADFYELKGIVSAPVHSMTPPHGWQSVKTSTSLSWIPLENTQPREIDIEFSANSGVYTFRSEEHTSELQSRGHLVCRLLLEKKKSNANTYTHQCTDRHASYTNIL